MVGAFEPNTRVLVRALKVAGTVIGLCDEMDEYGSLSTAVYHVRLDVPMTYDGGMADLLHCAETAIVRLPPSVVQVVPGDIVKWHPGYGWETVIGKVAGGYSDENGQHYFVNDTNGTLWELDANQGSIFVVRRETEGTEKLTI